MEANALYDEVVRLLRAGDVARADAVVAAELDASGGDAWTFRAAAQVAFAAGDDASALAWVDRAVALGDEAGSARLERAQLLAACGEREQAIEALEDLSTAMPTYEVAFLLGRLHYDARREPDAARAFALALAMRPGDAPARRALAESLFGAERFEEAAAHFEALSAVEPADLALALRCIRCLSRCGDVAGALARLREVASRFPTQPQIALLEGQLLEDAGQRDGAVAAYERARTLAPAWPEPVAAQLLLTHQDADDALRDTAVRLADDPATEAGDLAFLHYALGKAEAARGEHAQAWSHWVRANAIRRTQSPAEGPDALRRRMEALRETYTRERVDAWAAHAPRDERPVLVVGMPRSGTTLVEQVLAAHPLARGAGESPVLPRMHVELSSAGRLPAADDIGPMAGRYLDALVRRAGGDARRLVDKQPYNFLFLGLAAALLPHARVVWCRRDARDVAVSVFSESFAPHARFATDLAETRELLEAQDALMAHWRGILRLPVLEVRYEDMVSDFDAQARRLVEFAGLPWDDACLRFHDSTTPVQTNSRWQVRQPVGRQSVGRWRHHRGALAAAGFDVD